MAFPGSDTRLFLPFPRAPVVAAWGGVEVEAPAGLTSSFRFFRRVCLGSRRRSLPANQGHKCQPGAGWASCCWFVPLGFVSPSSGLIGRDNWRSVLGNRI